MRCGKNMENKNTQFKYSKDFKYLKIKPNKYDVNSFNFKDDSFIALDNFLDDDLYEETLKTQRAQAKKEEEQKRKLAVEKARKVKPKTSANPPRGSVKTSDLDSLLMTNIEGAGITR